MPSLPLNSGFDLVVQHKRLSFLCLNCGTKQWRRVVVLSVSFWTSLKLLTHYLHSMIIDALSNVGIAGSLLNWFVNYLSSRSQFVAIHGFSSPLRHVTSGVPQGSILGPLLFIVAFDGIFHLSLSSDSNMTGYADDVTYSKPLFSDNDIETAYADLDLICQWIGSHDLRLNLKKVKAMVISRKKLPPQPLLQICGEQIEFVSSFKLLGVIVTNNLSWTPHIMFSISKAKRLIGFLFRVFKEADEPFLSKLYKAIVLPHLEYCSCVWDPPFTKYITALERVQSFAARVVTNTWPLESAPLVESLQWPSLSQRRYFQKLCLCRRILCGFSIIPPSFFPLSTRPLSSHKNSFPLYHSFVRTHHHKSSFKHSVVSIWNKVPNDIINPLISTSSFKRSLWQYLTNTV